VSDSTWTNADGDRCDIFTKNFQAFEYPHTSDSFFEPFCTILFLGQLCLTIYKFTAGKSRSDSSRQDTITNKNLLLLKCFIEITVTAVFWYVYDYVADIQSYQEMRTYYF